MSLLHHSVLLLLLVIGIFTSQGCKDGESGLLKKSSIGAPLDSLGPTPCDNYGHISPMLHSLHKALYRVCETSCKVESLAQTQKRHSKLCEIRDRLSTQLPITM